MKEYSLIIASFLAVVVLGVLASLSYSSIEKSYQESDSAFLEKDPTELALLQKFGKPLESIQKGETFTDTGWRPLPAVPAHSRGYAFIRRGVTKVYIYIGTDGRVSAYFIAGT